MAIARRGTLADCKSMGAAVIAALALWGATAAAALAEPADERIVFVRHGEKPPGGLGQLNCRGLNRALALPAFIAAHFGKPDAIFAPNPAEQKKDDGKLYDYVRPLITIEPSAIAFGLPVDAEIGFADVKRLQAALEAPEYQHALVVVAWEHRLIDVVVRNLLAAHGGDPSLAPTWADDDFDGVDVVTIDANAHAAFARLAEGLDGQPEACPR
jgi:hypothetical protein